MTHEKKTTLRERTDHWLWIWKVFQTIGMAAGTALMIWTHFLGPGIRPAAQAFLGISDLATRLSWVEEFMPAPSVVDWNEGASFQIGDCRPGNCRYVLAGSRTPYGEECGRPSSVVPSLRLDDGRIYQISFGARWDVVELTRSETSFTVPLEIPSFIPDGAHQFRVRVLYPTCPGRNEPIPRWTPWFPLRVSG
ncbi:hypothetical protein [Limimaricola pyoseonensis]|uniref:Uncharacterized protein n=1 Tax=Limimaricola pyoseonensis TaxID=521013 RepID=A0A1G7GNV7_9RHOB|nr:hypothetical protein [Limimaricola pyoseonensis]SDE89868.1 hypothetical protein SAMN04488567_2864 [Limimaricola pyoseonensis]